MYTDELLELTQESSTNITLSDYPNTPIIASLYILPTPVTLYSMDFIMTIQDLEEGTVAGKCALIWLSTDCIPVLVSNIASRYVIAGIEVEICCTITIFILIAQIMWQNILLKFGHRIAK